MDGTGILFEPILSLIPDNIEYEVFPLQKFESDLPIEQANELSEHLGNEEVLIFAESYSGLIAYELCKLKWNNIKHVFFAAAFLECPSFLSKLSPFIPLTIVRKRIIPTKMLSYLLFGDCAKTDLIDLFYRSLIRVSNNVLMQRLKVISSITPAITKIDIPSTYICADKDFLVSKKCIARFEELFTNLTIIELEGGHFIAQSNATHCWDSISKRLALLQDSQS